MLHTIAWVRHAPHGLALGGDVEAFVVGAEKEPVSRALMADRRLSCPGDSPP